MWELLKDVLKRLEDGTPPPPWAGIFGASPRPEDCKLILVPVPWEATTSYGKGTAQGPQVILTASHQLDLEDAAFEHPYRAGITMLPEDHGLTELNQTARAKVEGLLERTEGYTPTDPDLAFVNEASVKVNERVYSISKEHLTKDRVVAVVGGDHASPFGLMKALGEQFPQGYGVLHFDAHYDLRDAYEGFQFSHASIMHNVMERIPQVKHLAQVGIRDYSKAEREYQASLDNRASVFYGRDLFRRKARGETWDKITQDILSRLPKDVYVSFDIDGLDPAFCPSTGTPVPGGISYDEAVFVIEELVRSGRRIIGFDLCEVAPGEDGDEWDANVGARMLYKLCGATLASQGACRSLL